ncbi:hypothetical protein PGTUg99_029462 [Puccinia graminis f. sp. tritici]|uniref:Uncharacterized protein n=1 Tax=Puccinia graminis f. sp. tritici TaxID=56615 RepID=A0A5B0Q4C0_PUCGR|nr:hypothetical protein PGTUg99_029462 [Puccinia graminis f. sp. tritici]
MSSAPGVFPSSATSPSAIALPFNPDPEIPSGSQVQLGLQTWPFNEKKKRTTHEQTFSQRS